MRLGLRELVVASDLWEVLGIQGSPVRRARPDSRGLPDPRAVLETLVPAGPRVRLVRPVCLETRVPSGLRAVPASVVLPVPRETKAMRALQVWAAVLVLLVQLVPVVQRVTPGPLVY